MSTPVISLTNICLGSRSAPVLDEVSFRLGAGHFMGIVGPNGAGKSTLLSVIAGLAQPGSGRVNLFGKRLRRLNRHKLLKQIGFLTQLHDHEPRLPLRVRDIVAMGLEQPFSPLWKGREDEQAVLRALKYMEMEGLADCDFRYLSGGQRQRTRIARTLVNRPRLLLLDEPSAALDSKQQNQLFRLLRQLCDEQDIAVIMVEHDIAAITSYVDSVACLNRRIHHHAMKGEQIPEDVWHAMYGDHIHVIAHDAACIGCATEESPI
ncbi:MAG: metal ABC transporter ATP-binding protein [Mariprofundaceae bacterium]